MSGSRSSQLRLNGVTGRTITGYAFRQTPPGDAAITLHSCHDITVSACDFQDVPGGVYVVDCSNIVLEGLRYSNITGPSRRTGASVGNLVQFDNVKGATLSGCKGRGGDTEDIVSVYQSWDIVIEDNHFEGADWVSETSAAIALGDQGGGRCIARRNTVLNPGQAGICIAGGVDCRIEDNIVVGEQRPGSNVGIYVWGQGGGAGSGHAVTGNVVSWTREDGLDNPSWNAGNCGAVEGWRTTNDWHASIDPATLRVIL